MSPHIIASFHPVLAAARSIVARESPMSYKDDLDYWKRVVDLASQTDSGRKLLARLLAALFRH